MGNYTENSYVNLFQLKKETDFEPPSNDFFWKVDLGAKAINDLMNRYVQDPMPRCLRLYMDSPWDTIKTRLERRMFTKTWTLQ